MKKAISILAALAISASGAVNTFAISEELYSTETVVLVSELQKMTDAERTAFINENLDVKLQHLSRLAVISSNMAYDKIADEVKEALDDGLTAIEIKEAIYHSAAYCGYTRAAGALDAADEALKALGQDVTYSSRITSTEETRFNDGVSTQRFLFGAQRGVITDDMDEAMKLQTIYLAGICFGDFYNRVGLSLYTREFLTFCTISGNGTCQGQLSSHANGNLSVGHSKDMLRAAILLNEDINGEDKTVTALGIINSLENDASTDVAPEPETPTNTITTDYTSDSDELMGIMEHYKTDDEDGFISSNLDDATQAILIDAAEAVVNGTELPTSDDRRTQLLIDMAVMTAQGGREAEIPAKVAENIEAGNTDDMIFAVPMLCVPYNGFPRTLNMRASIASALENISESTQTVVTMQIGNPQLTVNGMSVNIDDDGTAPTVVNDRTLLPIRAFVEAIGGTVTWDEGTQTVTLNYDGNEIQLIINSTTAYLNGNEAMLDTAPVIINDRTMLPIRFIAESFGYKVEWAESTLTVTITGVAENI